MLAYLDCPKCGNPIPEPFTRGNDRWHFHVHRRGQGHKPCRIVVRIDPGGESHRARVVPDDLTAEEYLKRLLGQEAA